MKKTSILLGLMSIGFFATAQVRMALYEEFTGENCPPCASTNPGLNTLLAANATKVIPIKWQVPIPSAPSTTWSLYQTDKGEIDWRWKLTTSPGYGYSCTVCSPTAAYINSAPSGRMDGQELNAFGLTGTSANHPGNLTAAAISSAQAQATPFTITMTPTWDATFSTATVAIAVQSSAIFNSVGTLKFRTVLIERLINFPTAPGTNGEKDFADPVRKCYSTTPSGTTISTFGDILPSSWTASQIQTFTLVCAIPSYINDKGQMAFVGFIQDDGNQKVYQAYRTASPPIPNEAKAMAIGVTSVVCGSTIAPTATLKNNGVNAITAMTVTPYMNLVAGTPVVWTGNLAVGASTTINMGVETTGNGTNTYSFTITGVSGGDVVMSNNGTSQTFFNTATYGTNPINEGFVAATDPPTGWAYFNPTGAPYTWVRSTSAGGFGTSSEAVRVFINWTAPGGTHDMYLPGTSFTGTLFPSVKFDLSYTQISASTVDQLALQVSTNCGSTWTNAWSNSGAAMATTPYNNASLNIPTASQWSLVTVPLTSYSNNPTVLVRFRATSGQGNVIWLDNINLYNNPNTGIATTQNAVNGFDVYPNPASNEVNVSITSANASSSVINITNTLGQVIVTKEVSLNAGTNTIQLDTKTLASGIYYVTYGSGKGSVTKKLTITK